MSNMRHWQKLCAPPAWAIKPIQAGRLKGKSDINPQWRMMAMTEAFGPCGEGWKYTIDKLWNEPGSDEQVMGFALVSVYTRTETGWSEPVPGIGGSMLVEKETRGLYTSDEGYKMAVTDALSVAFKALGVAANIYSGDRFDGSKYSAGASSAPQPAKSAAQGQAKAVSKAQTELLNELAQLYTGDEAQMADALHTYSSFQGTDGERYLKLADLSKVNDNEKFQRWVGSALGKLRKEAGSK